ncbi:hypothetical protein BDZ97DRAFT_1915532 [Flammula alnicola]|nr:hypothetical protein BDZ97DRAFT_1915532 [Flammula alnicola]
MEAGNSTARSNQDNKSQAQIPSSAMSSIRTTAPHLLQRLQQGISKLELVYTPHSRWPLPPRQVAQPHSKKPLRISILDSSFNPPTLAHLSLANSRWSIANGDRAIDDTQPAYDAKLLLLSVKNADKTLKPGDARYEQRLEMMSLLAKSMRPLNVNATSSTSTLVSGSLTPEESANVAIAIIDEPTFAGKSTALLAFLRSKFAALPPPTVVVDDIELTFLVGLDTLQRLFSPRYYLSEEVMMTSMRRFFSPGPDGDNSRIVSARRVMSTPDSEEDAKALARAKEFIDSGRIVIIDMGDEISTYSSTTVRRSVGSLGRDDGSAGSWRRLVTKDVADYIVQERLYEAEL